MTGRPAGTVVIGLGNTYRRDDGVGLAVAAALGDLGLPNVVVAQPVADPMGLVEAWSGAGLAIVIDAAVGAPSEPGRVRRCALGELTGPPSGLTSHSVDVAGAHALGQALGRAPDEVVVVTVEAADTGHGVGLTPPVSRAVPEAVRVAVAEIARVNERRPPPTR